MDRGALLVSDDYTILTAIDGRLSATPPATIAGRLEVRGIGIIPFTHVEQVPVALLVRLSDEVDRMPEVESRWFEGVPIPAIALDPREVSAPIKVELAVKHLLERAP